MYFESHRVLKSVFDFNGVSALNYKYKNLRYLWCAKVNVHLGTENMLGYVLDEDSENFKVILTNGQCAIIKSPKFHIILGDSGKVKHVTIVYNINSDRNKYVITKFWPVRIKISMNDMDNFSVMVNKVVLSLNKSEVYNILSSWMLL